MNLLKILSKPKKLQKYIKSLVGSGVYTFLPTWIKHKLKTYVAALVYNDTDSAEAILTDIVDSVFKELFGYDLCQFCRKIGLSSVKKDSPFIYRTESGITDFAPCPIGDNTLDDLINCVEEKHLEDYLEEVFGDRTLKAKILKIQSLKREEKLRQFSQVIELKILNKKEERKS